jgi:hypothetical protein
MATTIQIKRGDGTPGSLLEGEIALDKTGKRLLIGGDGGTDVFTISGMSAASGWDHFQEPVLDIQTDATLDPGASPAAGARYLITASGSLHANFGTITGVGDGDIVEYDANDSSFQIVYDASVAGVGGKVFDQDSGVFYTHNTGTSWSAVDAAVSLDDAYNNGAAINLAADTGVSIANSDQTGVGAMLAISQSGTGASTSLLDLNNTGADDTIAIDMSGLNTGDTAIAFGTGQAPTTPAAGNFWYASNDLSYHDGTSTRTVANLEEDQSFSGDMTFSTGLNLTSTTADVYTIATPTGGFSSANSIVNKSYVDSVGAGLDPKESVRAGTTSGGGNIAGYVAGTITIVVDSNLNYFPSDLDTLTIDGTTMVVGDRVLLKDQTDAKQNGIYEVTAIGARDDGGTDTSATLTRADDHDGTPTNEVSGGNFTFVEQGTTNADSGWVLQGDGNLTLDTDSLVWVQFSGSGSFTASNGVTKSGSDFQADHNSLATTASINVAADSIAFVDADDSLTYRDSIGDLVTGIAGTLNGLSSNDVLSGIGELELSVRDLGAQGPTALATYTLAVDNGTSTKKMTGTNFVNSITNTGGNGLTNSTGFLKVDLDDSTAAAVDVANDSIAIIDFSDSGNTKKESISDLVAAMAGTGIGQASGVLSLDTSELPDLADAWDDTNDRFVMYDASNSDNREMTLLQLKQAFGTTFGSISLQDTGADHTVTLSIGEDNTGNHGLTFLVNDATRSIDLSGNLQIVGDFATDAAMSLDVDTAAVGELLIYNGSNVWTSNPLTGGDGVTVTSAAGSITLDADLKANGGLVFETNEIAVDLGASSITGTLAVGDGGTGLTTIAKGSLLVANTLDTLTALDGSTASDLSSTTTALLGYASGSDTLGWTTALDGGTL